MAPSSAEAKKPTAAAIIVDAESGKVLYESNSTARTYPASLTKMMTLYLLFEAIEAKRIKLTDLLPVSSHASAQPATDLNLQKGQSIAVEKAILALIVHSANDVAVVVGEAIGGTESQFAGMMTKKARELGMKSTTFRNASGLPASGQTTTARDMAILARALVTRFPGYYHYFATENFSYGGRVYSSHNRVMMSYAGADGLKTGYIRASGFNVATSAMRDGRRIIAVVLGGRSARARDQQMMGLLDKGFDLVAKKAKTQIAAVALPPAPAAIAATKQPASSIATVLVDTALVEPETVAEPSIQIASLDPIAPAADAPAPVEAAPAPATSGKTQWGIQVGAFNAYDPALSAAKRASKRVAKLVKDAQIVVDETAKGKTTLYRARLVGLTKPNAQAACRQLKKKAIDCLVFQANVSLAMNSAP